MIPARPVHYWEPAKFAATLRYMSNTPRYRDRSSFEPTWRQGISSVRVIDTELGYLKQKAFDYAFLLDQVGLAS